MTARILLVAIQILSLVFVIIAMRSHGTLRTWTQYLPVDLAVILDARIKTTGKWWVAAWVLTNAAFILKYWLSQ